jgi:hypothetical protein
MINHLNGTVVNAGGISGAPIGAAFPLASQNIYNGAVQVLRSF